MERKNKVLVVDDEKSVCESVRRILSCRGLIVDEALSGEEALQKMERSSEYAVLIVDLVMPKVSGEQLLKIIKEQWPQVSVIIITGYASIQSAVRTTKLGAMEYLPKPFTPAELKDATEKAIEKYYQEQKEPLPEDQVTQQSKIQAEKELLTEDQAVKQSKIYVDVPYVLRFRNRIYKTCKILPLRFTKKA